MGASAVHKFVLTMVLVMHSFMSILSLYVMRRLAPFQNMLLQIKF